LFSYFIAVEIQITEFRINHKNVKIILIFSLAHLKSIYLHAKITKKFIEIQIHKRILDSQINHFLSRKNQIKNIENHIVNHKIIFTKSSILSHKNATRKNTQTKIIIAQIFAKRFSLKKFEIHKVMKFFSFFSE
jgi:hypothetical protein